MSKRVPGRKTDERAILLAERFRGLAEPMRLRLLLLLREGELSVGELVTATGAGQANISKHLQVLHKLGFLRRRKVGTSTLYSVADRKVFRVYQIMRHCGKSQAAPPSRTRLY